MGAAVFLTFIDFYFSRHEIPRIGILGRSFNNYEQMRDPIL